MSLFYQKVTVYADHRKMWNGQIKGYGKMRATKYAYGELRGKHTLVLYDKYGNKVMQYVIGGRKDIIHFHGFEGRQISGKNFAIQTRENREKLGIKEQEPVIAPTINYEPIIQETMLKFITNKDYFLSVQSNFVTGSLLWCADVARQTHTRLNVPEEALKETLKRLFYE